MIHQKNSAISKLDIWGTPNCKSKFHENKSPQKFNSLTYCICQRKKYTCHTHYFPFSTRFSSSVLFMNGMHLPSSEGYLTPIFSASQAGTTLPTLFPRRLCTHWVFCLYPPNFEIFSPEPFSIGSLHRLFSAESAVN